MRCEGPAPWWWSVLAECYQKVTQPLPCRERQRSAPGQGSGSFLSCIRLGVKQETAFRCPGSSFRAEQPPVRAAPCSRAPAAAARRAALSQLPLAAAPADNKNTACFRRHNGLWSCRPYSSRPAPPASGAALMGCSGLWVSSRGLVTCWWVSLPGNGSSRLFREVQGCGDQSSCSANYFGMGSEAA